MTETIEIINQRIEDYLSRNSTNRPNFLLQHMPKEVSDFVGLYLSSDKIEDWSQDKRAFDGKSPLEVLSELDSNLLRINVGRVYDAISEVLAFASVPELPNADYLYNSVRKSQFEQLGL
jgi:hypothetical protein